MNSITYSIGFILANLVANIYCNDSNYYVSMDAVTPATFPFHFAYIANSKDFLIMDITLKNIEPSVTSVSVIFESETSSGTAKAITGTRTGEAKFLVLKSLVHTNIFVEIELYSETGLCSTVMVADGRVKSTLAYDYGWKHYNYVVTTGKRYDDTGICLAPKPCGIVVDAKDLCQGSKEQMASNYQNYWLIYFLPTSIGSFILILLLYTIIQKLWCTNSHPGEDTVELGNKAPQNEVLYADLDFVTRVDPSRSQNEESHYATIVGVLHPR